MIEELINREAKGVRGEANVNGECDREPTNQVWNRLDRRRHCEKRSDEAIQSRSLKSCHPELDSGSYQQTPVECNVGEIPDQVRNDNKKTTLKLFTASPLKLAGFTMADRLARASRECSAESTKLVSCESSKTSRTHTWTRTCGFTMAEILLSLTIIGVVAAITLPSLTGNINERTWNTQRKALYARMSQALPLMDALNGFGKYTAPRGTAGTSGYNAGEDNIAETFITSGLSKVLKINNICDNEHLQDCGFPSKINPLGGGAAFETPTTVSALNPHLISHGAGTWKNTKAAAFETGNGESVVVYYNQKCIGSLNEQPFTELTHGGGIYVNKRICANFIYDLNGTKGPNTVGKDIGFMTVMYPFDAILYAPYPTSKRLSAKYALAPSSGTSATQACTDYDSEYRLPKADELLAMHANQLLIGAEDEETSPYGYISSEFWSASDGKYSMSQSILTGFRDDMSQSWQGHVWCIKR